LQGAQIGAGGLSPFGPLTLTTVTMLYRSVAYLGGALCEGPPLWPDRRDFCNYFGIIFSAV